MNVSFNDTPFSLPLHVSCLSAPHRTRTAQLRLGTHGRGEIMERFLLGPSLTIHPNLKNPVVRRSVMAVCIPATVRR